MCRFPTRISEETAWVGLKHADLFSQQGPSSIQGAREMPAFPGCLSLSASLSLSENTSPSVCKVSASCLTSLIYKANRTFLLTHIMLSLLMQKTIPGGRPRGPRETCQHKLFKSSARQILQDNISHNGVKIIFFFGPFQPLLWQADRNYFLTLLPDQNSG